MNYNINNIPNTGDNPEIYMEIGISGRSIGKIKINLFRDAFPAGVENFIKIITGETKQISQEGILDYVYTTQQKRTYQDNIFYFGEYNNYIMSGDIYNNNGTNAGTIYYDMPFTLTDPPFYYYGNYPGLLVLIPFYTDTEIPYYDSTFAITLSSDNNLDSNAIVIGELTEGLNVLDKINNFLKPVASRKYPIFNIIDCGIVRQNSKNKYIIEYIKSKNLL